MRLELRLPPAGRPTAGAGHASREADESTSTSAFQRDIARRSDGRWPDRGCGRPGVCPGIGVKVGAPSARASIPVQAMSACGFSPTWELYERWCFLRIGQLLELHHPDWGWRRSPAAAGGSVVTPGRAPGSNCSQPSPPARPRFQAAGPYRASGSRIYDSRSNAMEQRGSS